MTDPRLEALASHYKNKKLALHDYHPNKNASKSLALAHYLAKSQKKKLPRLKDHKPSDAEKSYKKLSIEEYEKLYQ